MQNIHWKKLLLIVVPLQIIVWIIPFTGLIKTDGFYGGMIMAAWIIYLTVGATIISALIVIISVHENRLKHFLIALLCAILLHVVVYNVGLSWLRLAEPTREEQMNKDLIAAQALFDKEVSLSIVEPKGGTKIISPVTVVVHAKQGVLTCDQYGCGRVQIKASYTKDKVLGEGNLMIQRHLTPEGKNVYQAVIPFTELDDGIDAEDGNAYIEIEGTSGSNIIVTI